MCFVAMSMMAQTSEVTDLKLESWSDPLTVYNDENNMWSMSTDKTTLSTNGLTLGATTAIAVVANPTVKSTLCVRLSNSAGTSITNQDFVYFDVYRDGTLIKTVKSDVLHNFSPVYFFDVEPGTHTFRFVARDTRDDNVVDRGIVTIYGLMKTNHVVEAEVTEPGSLGQEILYDTEVNVLADVRCLKIKGQLNDADWTTLRNMSTTLWKVDLSGVTNTSIPNGQFRREGATWQYLHEVVLPNGLTKIGDDAFRDARITSLSFPSTLDIIGHRAFYASYLETAALPASFCTTGCDNVEGRTYVEVFNNCRALKSLTLAAPEKLKHINDYFLYRCASLTGFVVPESVTEVGIYACNDCWNNDFGTLSSVKRFGEYCFGYSNNTNIDLQNAEWMYRYCFRGNPNLVSVAIGEKFWKFDSYNDFIESPNLKTVKLYSPTVCQYNSCFTDSYRAGMTLQVPNYLVNNYKVDANWMTFGTIEGFSTEDVDMLHVTQNLTMGARQRMEGAPSLDIANQLIFKIAGETEQKFNEVTIHANYNAYANDFIPANRFTFTQVLSTAPNVNVNKAVFAVVNTLSYYNYPMWYYLCLPFDIKVGDIRTDNGSWAIRYYDGAERAANGIVSGNKSWKDYAAEDVIKAGTGFIFQASEPTTIYFSSNGNGNQLFSTQVHSTPLAANASEVAANKGWNLVGNPYQCYYDAKQMNFNAPITTWTCDRWGTPAYKAYSLNDDDYIFSASEAFFVQAPDGVDHITFPIAGKQTVPTVQTASAKPRVAQSSGRQLVDITISDGENSDRTRVVMNEQASADYELTCDAGKMFSEGLQVYTIGYDGNKYAINERPMMNGVADLGVIIPAEGTYTFSLTRNSAERVILIDIETGAEVDLMKDSYTFNADKGTNEGRFILKLASDATAITDVANTAVELNAVYDLAGRRVSRNDNGLKSGFYVIGGRKVYVK